MLLRKTMDEVLVKYNHDPLCGYSKDGLMAALAESLRGRAEQLWLFGSLAEGAVNAYSDVDLIIVCPTERPFPERGRDFEDLHSLGPELDIQVYTPGEFDRILLDPSPGFWRSVCQTIERII